MILYTVYRTANTVNGKYYFGVHKTKDPYDRYLGSGKLIRAAVKKYGEQAFLKNVCFIFDNPEEAFAKEHDLIETHRLDPMCYNLREGGSGGFDWINREGMNTAGVMLGGKAFAQRVEADAPLQEKLKEHAAAIRISKDRRVDLCLRNQSIATKQAALKSRKVEKREQARQSFIAGKLRAEIAKELGVAKSSVTSWVKDLMQVE